MKSARDRGIDEGIFGRGFDAEVEVRGFEVCSGAEGQLIKSAGDAAPGFGGVVCRNLTSGNKTWLFAG